MCVFKHFRAQRPNGWSDRDRGCTDRRAETPERRWCRSRVGRRHVARGTCRRVKVYQKFSRAPGGQTGRVTEPKLPNMRLVETNKIMVGQSGLVVVHFTPRFLSGSNRVLVSSKPNYTILQQTKMKVVNIGVVAKGLIYPIEKSFVQ